MKKNNTPSESAREVIGQFLQQRAKELNKTAYRIAMETGLIQNQIHDVFSGSKNYTIDTLFKISIALELYIFFGEKDKNKKVPLDLEDMLRSMAGNNSSL